jgi:hypothetical protein
MAAHATRHRHRVPANGRAKKKQTKQQNVVHEMMQERADQVIQIADDLVRLP